MPTGIEEFFAAIAAAVVQGAALAPFTGSAPTASTTASSDAAAGASDPIVSVEMMEGEAVVTNAGPSGGHGSGTGPVTGDRPTTSTSTADAAPGARRGAWDFDPAFLDVDKGLAAAAGPSVVPATPPPAAEPQPPAGAATGTSGSGSAPPPPPGSLPVPSGTPTFAAPPGAPLTGTPAVTGPAATAPAASPAVAPGSSPPAARPPSAPDSTPPPGEQPEPDIEVPAGLADNWERHSKWTPAKLIFGRSGEDLAARMKKKVRDVIGEVFVTSDDPEQYAATEVVKQVHATAIQTVADVVIDAGITPILDPGAPWRGILRTGTATPTGIEEVRQAQTPAETVLGVTKVVGEVSGVVLMVVAPIDAGMSKGAVPKIGEPSVTMLVEEAGPGLGEQVSGGHVRLEIRTAGGDLVTTDALATSSEPVIRADGTVTDVQVVNQARSYPTPSPEPSVMSYTHALSAEAADNMVAAVADARAGQFAGVQGGLGVWSQWAQHCGTYAASIARAGGLPVVGVFGSRIAFQMFKGSGVVTHTTAAGLVHAGVENTVSRGSDVGLP